MGDTAEPRAQALGGDDLPQIALKGRHRFLPHKTCAALSVLIQAHDPFPGLASWALLCRAFGTKPRLDPAPPSWGLPDTTRSAGGVFIESVLPLPVYIDD
jgi:hypothetical protein